MSKPIGPEVRVVYGRLWRYVTPHKLVGFLAVMCMATTAVVEAGLVWLLAPLMDETLVAKNLEASRWIPYAFFGIFVMRGLSGLGTEWSMGWIGRRVISDLRRDVFRKLLTLPIRFFDNQAAGPLMSRMSYNVEMVAESVTSVVTIAVRDVLTVIAAFAVMIWFSRKLTIFIAVLFPLVAFLVQLLGVAFRRYSARIQDTIGEVTQVTDEVVRGNRVVKAFSGYAYERERFDDADGRNFKQNMKMIRVRSLGTAVTQIIFAFGIALVIAVAARESVQNRLTPGEFIAFFSAMSWMLQPVRRITNVNATLQRGVAGADSLFQIIDEDDEVDGGTYEVDRVRGDVAFEDVSFSYGDSEESVIDRLSVEVPAGSTLAIVGHSGSGKTTLLRHRVRHDQDRWRANPGFHAAHSARQYCVSQSGRGPVQ